jgi:8-oxo-dGTP pyrophosphatase MutT (NUDIX family)
MIAGLQQGCHVGWRSAGGGAFVRSSTHANAHANACVSLMIDQPDAPASVAPPLVATAAAVLLCRQSASGLELYLVRRHSGSAFMPDQYVFPGGRVDAGESPRAAAVRELFEEAGVLLGTEACAASQLAPWRRALLAGEAGITDFLGSAGTAAVLQSLPAWGRWLTPSTMARRFDTRFYIAALPAGQEADFATGETSDGVWVSPATAIARHAAGRLALPVPQLNAFLCLEQRGLRSLDALLAAAEALPGCGDIVMPRPARQAETLVSLMPWDAEYFTAGEGEALALGGDHHLAIGPSRFHRVGQVWRY